MADWPETLPQSLQIDGYTEGQQDGTIRTSMDAGPAFVRRRFSAVTKMASGYQMLSAAEYTALMTFFDSTLSGGSATFTWHPRGAHQNSPQVIYSMRFLSPPSRRSVAGDDLWQVDMAFEILP